MQLLACEIAVAGDDNTIVVRDYESAVTFPELMVIRQLHGAMNVRHVVDIGEVDRDSDDERGRLASIYGHDIVKHLFQAEHMALPETDPRVPKRPRAEPIMDDNTDALADASIPDSVMASAAERVRSRGR